MHQKYLLQALELAEARRGFCAPNPAVGAVIVKNDRVLARGQHWAAGGDHAEVDAIQRLTGSAEGATLYVTLEPCCHWGRTPPCTKTIIQQGIACVVYAVRDPNPAVAGKGIKQLEQAGIQCVHYALPQIETFYQSYAYWLQQQRPWVTAKLALSLDGKIAAAGAKPAKITSEELNRQTHLARKQADAILTTAKTINNDDPQFNVRLENEILKKPLYVLDRQLQLKTELKIYGATQAITLFHDAKVSAERINFFSKKGIRCIAVKTNAQGLDLSAVLAQIGEDGIQDLWVEVGATCLQSLLAEKLINRCLFYVAPKILGEQAYSGFVGEDELAAVKNVQRRVCGEETVWDLDF